MIEIEYTGNRLMVGGETFNLNCLCNKGVMELVKIKPSCTCTGTAFKDQNPKSHVHIQLTCPMCFEHKHIKHFNKN